MTDSNELEHWLDQLDRWEAAGSIHRRRLRRAFGSAEDCLAGNPERLLHSFSRIGIWASGVSADLRSGEISSDELQQHLEKLGEFGSFAFHRWDEAGECQAHFQSILHGELIPNFCSDPLRGFDATGFRAGAIGIADVDARDFLRAWAGGLIQHQGRGLYRAPKSAASEQFFWSGPKRSNPRTFTLWLEPIITVAALARLHWDHHWPLDLIGTQSSDWAFDLVAFQAGNETEEIAGEVKKTVSELDTLVREMCQFGENPDSPAPSAGVSLNAFRKVAALRTRRAPIFWAVGPGGYSSVFRVEYSPGGHVLLDPVSHDALAFENSWEQVHRDG